MPRWGKPSERTHLCLADPQIENHVTHRQVANPRFETYLDYEMLLLMQLRSQSEFLLLTAVATAFVATDGPAWTIWNSSKAFLQIHFWKFSIQTIKKTAKKTNSQVISY